MRPYFRHAFFLHKHLHRALRPAVWLAAIGIGGIAGFLAEPAHADGGRVVGWGNDDYGVIDPPPNATNVLAIATGAQSLALAQDGTLLAWGGGGTVPSTAGVSNLVNIAAGGFHSMGLLADGSLWVWSPQASVASVPAAATNIIKMSAGNTHVMTLRADGQVLAWGDDYFGQTDVPPDATNVVDIAAGGIHGMALRKDGVLRLWGQITRVPPTATNVVAIGATFEHCLALRRDRTVVEWSQSNDYATPPGLSNVVAISNGGADHWVALRADGTMVAWCWTDSLGTSVPPGLSNVTEIAAGSSHGLALADCSGLRLLLQPQSATSRAGDPVVFTCQALGAMSLTYTWTHEGSPIPGASQPFLVLDNVQARNAGAYRVFITNASGSITSQSATLTVLDSVPRIQLSPTNLAQLPGASASLSAVARGTEPMGFWWQKDGTNITGATGLGLSLTNLTWSDTSVYQLMGTNRIGTAASDPVGLNVVQAAIWGSTSPAQTNVPATATNLTAIACGDTHALALKADGSLLVWGDNIYGQCSLPASATNAIAVAAGLGLSLAAFSDGHCAAWGYDGLGEADIPAAATNVIAVAAGNCHCLALRQDGVVVAWGDNRDGERKVPAPATNIVAIACGDFHNLALRNDGTIQSWGQMTYGQTNVPASATNIVAIAGGTIHSLALRRDGTVLAWGDNSAGQCNVPASLSNAVAIAAAGNFSLALSKDGTVVGWGDNTNNRTVTPLLVTNVDAIAAGSGLNGALVGNGTFYWCPPTTPNVTAGSPLVLLPRFFGHAPDRYQWWFNGVPVTGATNAWLTFPDAQQFVTGTYQLVVTTGSSSLTGTVATVTVVPTAPVILQAPTSRVVALGGSTNFSVLAQGTEPITYQWRFNGSNLAGATGTTLSLSNVQWTNTGTYDVVVSNPVGNTTSSGATLTFQPTVDAFDLGVNNFVYALAPQPDGKVVLGGSFTALSGQWRTNLARLNADGTLDATFISPVGGVGTYVHSLAVQPDAKIVVGGEFTSLCGQGRTNLARLNADGSLDVSFRPLITGGAVNCLALQPDGKIVLGGTFTDVQGLPRASLARLNPDGSLDGSFNVGAGGTVWSLAMQPDGSIIVGGSFTTLAGLARSSIGRLSAEGLVDPDFNPGVSGTVYTVYALAVQPDGCILIGGVFSAVGGQSRSCLARLSADGTPDLNFNPGANASVGTLALQADGRILTGGYFTTLGGQPRSYLGRLNSDGSLDETFNPGANGQVYGLALQADGRVLAGGGFVVLGGQSRSRLARVSNTTPATQSLQCDGTNLDWVRGGSSPEIWRAAFEASTNGADWLNLGAAAYTAGRWRLTNAAVPPNATLRARGYATAGYQNGSTWFAEGSAGPPAISFQPRSQTNVFGTNVTFRVLAAGTPPLSYQWRKDGANLPDGGPVYGSYAPVLTLFGVAGADQGAYSVVVSNAAGSVTSTVATLTVVDPLITGQPVSQSTNAGKTVVFRATVAGSQPMSYQWRKDGMALVNATTTVLTLTNVQGTDIGVYDMIASNAFGLATTLGATLGFSAGADGFNPGAYGGSGNMQAVYALACQPDQKVLVAGNFTYLSGQARSYLGRLSNDGTLDRVFNPGADSWTFALAIQPNGQILVGGWFSSLGGQARSFIGRLYADGTLDRTFNPAPVGGLVSYPGVYALALQPDGKILVGGGFVRIAGDSCMNIARLNPDGSRDKTFNASTDEVVYSLALQPDGKILLGGNFVNVCGQARSHFARLNPDGSLDPSFNPGANGIPLALLVQPDGKLLVGGAFSSLAGQTCNRIGRLNPDGSMDASFSASADSVVRTLALQTDGRVLLGGDFVSLGTLMRRYIGRLNADGSPDLLFNPGASGTVYGLTLQPDGKVLAGGSFFSLGGASRVEIGRLTNTYPARQSLTLDGGTLSWLRSGASPEVCRVDFDASANGVDWFSLGTATRVAGGWQATNVVLPAGATVRARGAVASGRYNASLWFTETSFGPPAVSVPPASCTNVFGTVASFNVLAAGDSAFGYQWFKDGVALTNGGRVLGAYSPGLLVSNVSGADAGGYPVVITNASGSVTSQVAYLTVLDPFISYSASGLTTNVGQTVAFSVSAFGTPRLNYQWRKNGANLAGATTSSLRLSNLHSYDAGSYDVVVSNTYSAVASALAVLNVNPPKILVNDGGLGLHTNGFGFNISAVVGQPVMIEASTNLVNWFSVQTNVVPSGGVLGFLDPDSTWLPERFYRARYNDGP